MGKKQSPKSRKHRVAHSINSRRNTQRHILIKLTKIKCKEKILKAAREKQQITYKEIPIRLSADFSAESLQVRKEWNDIFKVMKGENLQARLLYPVRISAVSMEKSKALQASKTKRIQHHKTSFTTNAKGPSLGGKHKRRKTPTKTKQKQLRKWQQEHTF